MLRNKENDFGCMQRRELSSKYPKKTIDNKVIRECPKQCPLWHIDTQVYGTAKMSFKWVNDVHDFKNKRQVFKLNCVHQKPFMLSSKLHIFNQYSSIKQTRNINIQCFHLVPVIKLLESTRFAWKQSYPGCIGSSGTSLNNIYSMTNNYW